MSESTALGSQEILTMVNAVKELTTVVRQMQEREAVALDERLRKLERESDSRLAFTMDHHNAIMETSRDVKTILANQTDTAKRLDALERWRAAIMAICTVGGIVIGWIFRGHS